MKFKWQFKHDLTAQTLADTVPNGASNVPM